VATTPEEWLPILAKRMDYDMPRIKLLDRYTNGDAPLPEGGKNVKASWSRFQREARTNWGLMVREAVADRVVPNGITVAGSSDSPAAKQAQQIWRDNHMDTVFKDWLRHGLTFSQSFLTVWQGDTGKAVITADSPETMGVSADPLQPWRVRAAMRIYRDLDAEKDFAHVWCDGYRQKFSRPCFTLNQGTRKKLVRLVQGDWEPVGEALETGKLPPVVVYNNPGGFGEFEPHIDVINRINRGILNRLVIEAMMAYRQRALKTAEGTSGLPKKDAEGNDIDYAKVFEPAPGTLWDLPPGLDIWESTPTDISPLLMASKDDIRQLSSSTRTPLPMLMPDNANQSAAGAVSTDAGHLAKCEDRMGEAQVGIAGCMVQALGTVGVELAEDETLEVTFEPVATVSLAEKYAAAQSAKSAGVPTKSILRNVLGWSPEQVAQADVDAAAELFTTSVRETLTNPSATPKPKPTNAPAA
jgi:hypothetical protein